MRDKSFFIFACLIYLSALFDKGLNDFSFYFIYSTLSIFVFWFVLIDKKELYIDKGLILFFVLYLIACSSLLYSVNRFITVSGSILIASSIFFYLIFLLLDVNEKRKFLLFLFYIALILSIYGIYQTIFVSGDYVRSKGLARAHSIFVTPNTFAGFLGAVFFILFYELLEKKKFTALRLIGCLFMIFALFSTFSRTALIGLFFSFFIFFIFLRKKGGNLAFWVEKNKYVVISILFLAFIVAFFYFLKDPMYFKKRIVYVFMPFSAPSLKARILYWKSSLPLIKNFFPFGSGFYTFPTVYPWYKSDVFKGVMHFYAHNDLVQFFVELGVLGLFWGLLFWVTAFYMSLKHKVFLIPFFSFIFIFSIFEYVFYLPVFLFLFVYVYSVLIGFKRIKVKGLFKYLFVSFLLIVSVYNLNFILNLYRAENYVKKARLVISKKELNKKDWQRALYFSEKSEKLIPENIAYKMNSLRIMIILFNNFKIREAEKSIVKKSEEILPLAYNDKMSLKALCFYLEKLKGRSALIKNEYKKIISIYKNREYYYKKSE